MNSLASNTINRTQDAPWHWQAYLQLCFKFSSRGTTVNRCRHNGPLYVQKPFYPEGKHCAHVYLLHPPGGLVSGDTITIDVEMETNSHSLMTTPGATRLYRARQESPIQRQNIYLSLAENAILEWFPMETIVYDAAAAELNTTIKLSNNSRLMAWEITCLGLPASKQLMTQGYFQQRYKIIQDGLPIFIDRLHYDTKNHALFTNMAGMQSKTVSGFFIAGPFSQQSDDEKDQLIDYIRQQLTHKKFDTCIAISNVNGFFITRYLGHSANQARDAFTEIWSLLRPVLIKQKACAPRIWLT